MAEVIRNPEWKSIAVKTVVLLLLLAIVMFLIMSNQVDNINHTIVDQNAALAGYLLKEEPQLENKIIHYITQGPQQNEIDEGRRILAQYGYEAGMSVENQPALAGEALPFKAAAQVLLFGIPVMLLLLWEYRKLFGKIRAVSSAAEQVVEQQFDQRLPDNDEGDIGYLGRSFNAMAERLKNSLEQLQLEKNFLRDLLTNISHQLKTPLASLIMFNENMLNDPKMKEEMKVAFLERSRQQLNRMEWLIVSLLKLARVEAGAIVFHNEALRLRELIENVLYSLREVTEEKLLTIVVGGGGENIFIHGDEEWLKEAFTNLIKNAVEHTPKEGEIDIVLEGNSLFYTVIIRDHGEGIHSEDLPHIFTRFYRGKNAVKPQSVGIGLSLTKSIIEGQGGTIHVASKRGEGTEFRISFFKGR